jgi:hypothetical protein
VLLEERRFLSAVLNAAMPATASAVPRAANLVQARPAASGVAAAQAAVTGTYNGVLKLRQRDAAGRGSFIVTLAVTSQDAAGNLSGTFGAPEFGNTSFTGQLAPAGRRGQTLRLSFTGDRDGTVEARVAARNPNRVDGTVKDAAGKRLGTFRLNRISDAGVAPTAPATETTPPSGSTSTSATTSSASTGAANATATNSGVSATAGSTAGVISVMSLSAPTPTSTPTPTPTTTTATTAGTTSSGVTLTPPPVTPLTPPPRGPLTGPPLTPLTAPPRGPLTPPPLGTNGTTPVTSTPLLGPGTAGSGASSLGGPGIGDIPPGPTFDPANPPTLTGAPTPSDFDIGSGGGMGVSPIPTGGSSVVDTSSSGVATSGSTASPSTGSSVATAVLTSDILFEDSGDLSGLGLLALTGRATLPAGLTSATPITTTPTG